MTAKQTNLTSERTFTVMMHRQLVDELDEGFSPMDGIVAIDEMFSELPILHRALAPLRLRKRAGRKLKVYRGCYDWYNSLGFSYVQIGNTLHVLELWFDENPNLAEMDVILGTGQTEGYKPCYDVAENPVSAVTVPAAKHDADEQPGGPYSSAHAGPAPFPRCPCWCSQGKPIPPARCLARAGMHRTPAAFQPPLSMPQCRPNQVPA